MAFTAREKAVDAGKNRADSQKNTAGLPDGDPKCLVIEKQEQWQQKKKNG